MSEYKFRGKRIDNGEWHYGFYREFSVPEPWKPKAYKDGVNYYIDAKETNECHLINPETVGQFTGLYDATKWEQLTEAEQNKFYLDNRSEDGKTIKYPTIEDVKRLWKGKEIYEGDIVHCDARFDNANMVVVFEEGEFHMVLCEKFKKYIPLCGFYCIRNFTKEVIGNIYDNPELLEVAPCKQ